MSPGDEILLDTNVIVRHLAQDHVGHSLRADRFVDRIGRDGAPVFVPATVVFESVFVLQKFHRIPKSEIRAGFERLLSINGLRVERRAQVAHAFEIFTTTNLSFADAFHAAVTLGDNLAGVASFDRGLDRVPGLRRVEP